MVYEVGITTSKDKIINIKNKDDKGVSHFLGVDSVVRMTPRKAIYILQVFVPLVEEQDPMYHLPIMNDILHS